MPNLPVDIPPTAEPYYGLAQYGPSPQVQVGGALPVENPIYGYTPTAPNYSQTNWDALGQQYHGTQYYDYSPPSANISAGDLAGRFLRNLPVVQLFTDPGNIPAVRFARSIGHFFTGTLGQHENDGQDNGQSSTSRQNGNRNTTPWANMPNGLRAYPILQFNSAGQITNGAPGGTGTVAGWDPYTGRPVWNASPVDLGSVADSAYQAPWGDDHMSIFNSRAATYIGPDRAGVPGDEFGRPIGGGYGGGLSTFGTPAGFRVI